MNDTPTSTVVRSTARDESASSLSATGEMADLIRSYDWSATPLKAISTWSETLLCSVNILLTCRFPMLVFWGPEMIQLYNDAYVPLMPDKHPGALGESARECYKEAWHIVGPQIEEVLRDGAATYQENVLVPVTRAGRLQNVYWTYSYSPIVDRAGTISGILIVCHDVTEEVVAKRERDLYSEQLQQVLEVTTDGVMSIDRHWNVTYMNEPAQAAAGPIGDVVGRNFWESFPGAVYENSPFVENYHRAMEESVPLDFEAFYPEPLKIWVRVQVRPTRDGIVVFFRDVTEERRTAAALIQSEKLAAVGRLAASIAHEINNPLESVTNLLFLARTSKDVAEIQRYLETADRELLRVSAISNQTLRFYKQSTNAKPVTCEELMDSVLSLHQGRIVNSGVQVERRRRARRPVVCLDGEIRQVLNNLVANAIDAMHPAGGVLSVRSREATDWATNRRGVVLTIADTGGGIDAESLPRIFDPFFTTKGIGGTGLGLWVSQQIILRHKGVVRVRSSQNAARNGTVVSLFLPFDAKGAQVAGR